MDPVPRLYVVELFAALWRPSIPTDIQGEGMRTRTRVDLGGREVANSERAIRHIEEVASFQQVAMYNPGAVQLGTDAHPLEAAARCR